MDTAARPAVVVDTVVLVAVLDMVVRAALAPVAVHMVDGEEVVDTVAVVALVTVNTVALEEEDMVTVIEAVEEGKEAEDMVVVLITEVVAVVVAVEEVGGMVIGVALIRAVET